MFRAHVLIIRRAKIVLYSLWYHYTETGELSKITKIISGIITLKQVNGLKLLK